MPRRAVYGEAQGVLCDTECTETIGMQINFGGASVKEEA